MSRRVTIKDVAIHAEVGIGTVSRVLNKNKNVKPHLRKKVEEAIRELDYQPDSIARSLRTNKSKTVVFFVPDISNIAFSSIAKGLHEILEEHGYNLILHNIGFTGIKDKVYQFFSSRKVDGAIVAFNEEDNSQVNKFLSDLNIPLLILDRDLENVPADCIYTDYYGGMKAAVEHLVDLGHKNIGCINGSTRIRPVRESLRGYMDALKLNDLTVNHNFIKTGDFTFQYGRNSLEEVLEKIKAKELTSIIAGGYAILVGIIEVIQKEGLVIPDDLSLIAFEDSDVARLMTPSITVIRRPLNDMGKKMGYFLLDRLSDEKDHFESSSMIVPTELVIRSSTKRIE